MLDLRQSFQKVDLYIHKKQYLLEVKLVSYLCLREEDPPLAPLAEGELDAVLLGGVHGAPAHPHPRQAAHVGGHAPHAAARAPHQARN